MSHLKVNVIDIITETHLNTFDVASSADLPCVYDLLVTPHFEALVLERDFRRKHPGASTNATFDVTLRVKPITSKAELDQIRSWTMEHWPPYANPIVSRETPEPQLKTEKPPFEGIIVEMHFEPKLKSSAHIRNKYSRVYLARFPSYNAYKAFRAGNAAVRFTTEELDESGVKYERTEALDRLYFHRVHKIQTP